MALCPCTKVESLCTSRGFRRSGQPVTSFPPDPESVTYGLDRPPNVFVRFVPVQRMSSCPALTAVAWLIFRSTCRPACLKQATTSSRLLSPCTGRERGSNKRNCLLVKGRILYPCPPLVLARGISRFSPPSRSCGM